MNTLNLDDYRWLVSSDAAPWFDLAGDTSATLHKRVQHLRRDIGVSRAQLLIAQAELRVRGRRKFGAASRMFFTKRSLEQATSEGIASHKAKRFQEGESVADLCCGIGGDLLALALSRSATGVDQDDVVAILAQANCRALGVEANITKADAATFDTAEVFAWHLDPDRRTANSQSQNSQHRERRSVDPRWHAPPLDVIEQLTVRNPRVAIKLAPAAAPPQAWTHSSEREWISQHGECKQQVVWRHDLAKNHGGRQATILSPTGEVTAVFSDSENARGDGVRANVVPAIASHIGRYIFEPDSAVIAARLVGLMAVELGLEAIAREIAYLTGDSIVAHAALARFEVLDVLPFDLKRLRAYFRERRVGRLEIKKRGVSDSPEDVRRKLKLKGDHSAVLLLAPREGRVAAIVARRDLPAAKVEGSS